jgi:hypothetical protein
MFTNLPLVLPFCTHSGTCDRLPCRGLSLIPGLGFASASHDGTLRLWTNGGDAIAALEGHTALVYR